MAARTGVETDGVAEIWRAIDELRATVGRHGIELAALRRSPAALDDGTIRRKDAARLLDLTVSTLNRMAVRGEGPPFMRRRGRVYYRRKDVLDWKAANERPIRRHRAKPGAPLPLFSAAE